MVVDFLRGLATGALVVTATTTLVQPTGATTSSPEMSEQCPTEVTACRNDEACVSCFSVGETSSATFYECGDDITLDDFESSAAVCSARVAAICCFDEASDHACIANDNFVDVWLCYLNVNGCPVDEITCDEDGGPLVSSSGATANVGCPWIPTFFCALFVPFLSLLSV